MYLHQNYKISSNKYNKIVQELYEENYKTLLKDKKNLSKHRYIHHVHG